MAWTPITEEQVRQGLALVERIREARAAPGEDPAWLPADALLEQGGDPVFARAVVTWIRTASAAGYGWPNWLPCQPDFHKSALLERLRSGLDPLDEPPPLGLSCPWYALIEDPGPHYVMDAWKDDRVVGAGHWVALQNVYEVVEERGERDFVVRDAGHDTTYRFRLWHDPEWRHPSGRLAPGGWFLRNLAFEEAGQA